MTTTTIQCPVERRHGPLAEGMAAMLPVLAGIAPFGLAIGVAAADSSVGRVAGWATSWTIYAGSAQLATIELLDAGAAPLIVLATVVAVNARLLLYGAAIAPHWREAPRWWRLLASYLLVDPSYAVAADRYQCPASPEEKRRFYLGAALTLWGGWQVATALGVVLSANAPGASSLEMVVPLTMAGLLAGAIRSTGGRVAATVAAVTAVAVQALPLGTGVIVAAVAGMLAGAATEGRDR